MQETCALFKSQGADERSTDRHCAAALLLNPTVPIDVAETASMTAHSAPTSTHSRVVVQSITELIGEYIDYPLRCLREVNLQVRLGHILLANLQREGVCLEVPVGVWPKRRVGTAAEGRGVIIRVQHEVKIAGTNGECSDTVVLREATDSAPIELTRWNNGHLDIVASIRPQDVAAVIELKAACSADPSQRHGFRSDVAKLLRLSKIGGQAIERHFVLIDKAISVSGHAAAASSKAAVADWHVGAPYKYSSGRKEHRRSTPSPQLALEDTPEKGFGAVHIWDIDADSGGPRLRHRICAGFRDTPAASGGAAP